MQMLRMPSERRDDLEKGSGKYSRLSGGRGITGTTRRYTGYTSLFILRSAAG